MKKALLLFLSANQLHAQFMAGGKIATQRDFPSTPAGHEDFANFLKAVDCPAYLLVDLIEEDFRQEIVPHLSGGKRTALLQRKFEQYYRGSPFHQATLLQRQKTGRRDDDMLFSALTNPAHIMPWLNVMLAQRVRLAGIYSVPQISAPLVKDHPSHHLLLISWEKFSGLRQTYFSEHRLQISRLTPVYAEQSFRDAVVKELARTFQYLKSLSLLPAGQILDVRILCHRNDMSLLKAQLPDNSDMRYDFADIEEIGKQLNIDYLFADSDASQIFLQRLATQAPKSHYANASHTHYFTLWHLKHALNLASGAVLAGGLLWGASSFWQSSGDVTETELLNAQAQRALNEAQKITLTFPSTYAPAADMKSAVNVMRKLDQYAPAPLEVLKPVSAALDRYPQIRLDDLAWQMKATEPVAPGTLADVPALVITLKGHLADFANDYRGMLNYLERFQGDLTAQGFQVTTLSRPIDVSPSGSIADKRETVAEALGFSLKISRRPAMPTGGEP
ncbi:MAG: hypothetical protein OEV26_06720 [Gallionella sp.]|nr:hypothetical protein [Gallionella sp.]